jgi:hypothetical protein
VNTLGTFGAQVYQFFVIAHGVSLVNARCRQ